MLLTLLITNLLHAAVALLFCAGLRPFVGPLPAARWSHLLGLGIVLPVLIPLLRLLGVPAFPPGLRLLRSEGWLALLEQGGWPVALGGGVLLGGTFLIFLFQEALPLLLSLRGRAAHAQTPRGAPDAHLAAHFDDLLERFQAVGLYAWARVPKLFVVEDSRAIAAVEGLSHPRVVISTGLLERLDAQELEGVLAHELAHVARGGNLVRLALWIFRALQAPNPFALTLARAHFEANETACDALATQITRRPAALASALMRTRNQRTAGPGLGAFARARFETLRRSDLEATRARVLALLHRQEARIEAARDGFLLRVPRLLLIAGLLWSIA